MMKLTLMRTATGMEDPELPLLQRIRNYSTRVQVTDTSQHQLFRGDCVNQDFMFELLQRHYY